MHFNKSFKNMTVSNSIDSILNQTYEDFEFLIIDDFSKDESYAVIKDYEKSCQLL